MPQEDVPIVWLKDSDCSVSHKIRIVHKSGNSVVDVMIATGSQLTAVACVKYALKLYCCQVKLVDNKS